MKIRVETISSLIAKPAVAALFVAAVALGGAPAQAGGGKVYQMRVDGMTCPFCAKTSKKALRAIPGVKSASVNLKKGVVSVCAAPSAGLSAARMKKLFASKGFTFRSMRVGGRC